mgnify:FL=1|jgi:IS30 family transposase
MNRIWTIQMREQLKFVLSEGLLPTHIVKDFNISRPTLLKELKRGLTEDEYMEKRYIKYLPVRALKEEINEVFGEDVFSYIKSNELEIEDYDE